MIFHIIYKIFNRFLVIISSYLFIFAYYFIYAQRVFIVELALLPRISL